jgi:putative flippase GtrA
LAIAISYYLNRSWTFRDRHPSRLKFLKFIILSVILIVVNVSIAGLLFEYVEVGFDRRIWANLASLIGAIAAIIVKYFGAKRIFKNIEEK